MAWPGLVKGVCIALDCVNSSTVSSRWAEMVKSGLASQGWVRLGFSKECNHLGSILIFIFRCIT